MTRIVCVALLIAFLPAAALAKNKHAPLSPRVVSAKTVCITNIGPSKTADKIYEELNKWGQLTLVDSCEKADLEMVFFTASPQASSGTTSHYNYETGQWTYGTSNSVNPGSTQMQLLDAKNKELLYSDQRPSAGKRAISRMLDELKKRIQEAKQ